jgi:hypothetical protein
MMSAPRSAFLWVPLALALCACGASTAEGPGGDASSSGGAAGAGGSASGSSGAIAVAAQCPDSAPPDREACPESGMICTYDGDLGCACTLAGWFCQAPCPAAPPENDQACRGVGLLSCRYAGGEPVEGTGAADMTCTCGGGKFACVAASDCPEEPPTNQAPCSDLTNLSCSYGTQQCTCSASGWSCASACPEQLPEAGAACDRAAALVCAYSAGTLTTSLTLPDATCSCASGAFSCYSAADCPSEQPAAGTACTQPGLACAFESQSCLCVPALGSWLCGAVP